MSDDYKRRQAALIAERVKAADIIITTALIPGRPAPVLRHRGHVKGMKPGSVIVDMAVEQGGNCPLSGNGQDRGQTWREDRRPANLPAMWPRTPARSTPATCSTSSICSSTRRPGAEAQPRGRNHRGLPGVQGGASGRSQGAEREWVAVDPIIINLTVFVLAIFVGYHVVWNVTPALHTPLMSVTNAIAGHHRRRDARRRSGGIDAAAFSAPWRWCSWHQHLRRIPGDPAMLEMFKKKEQGRAGC